MRDKRCVPTADNRVDEDNVLRDKTLIDLCGATLFWRSGSGLSETASVDDLRAMIDGLNLARFQCPIMYRTLRLSPALRTTDFVDPPRLNVRPLIVLDTDSPPVSPNDSKSEPYVYLNCGHVHGWHTWLAECDKCVGCYFLMYVSGNNSERTILIQIAGSNSLTCSTILSDQPRNGIQLEKFP
ncbi:hypothetical protein AHF37_10373 [Paragonimus kellicotti]|nr:hypothetical protein AHF37_10373 [Paragonimus kellicotti]